MLELLIAKKLGMTGKTLTAETLYVLIRDRKITYDDVRQLEPKKFSDLEYTMRLIFDHDIIKQEAAGSSKSDQTGIKRYFMKFWLQLFKGKLGN